MISGISVVVFASQRLGLVQFSQSNREEDNLIAYYAAKAGIEDGLARVRFNRDVEIGEGHVTGGEIHASSQGRFGPSFYFGLTGAKYPSTEDYTFKSETSDGLNLSNVPGLDYDTLGQYYKLDVQFRQYAIGITSKPETPNIGSLSSAAPTLDKDQSVSLTGFSHRDPPYYLRYVFRAEKACVDANPAFVQLEQLREGNTQVIEQIKVRFNGATTVESNIGGNNWQIMTQPKQVTMIRATAYHCPVIFGMINSKTRTSDGMREDRSEPIDSLRTLITSTGYYGNARTTLVADVDRVSNTLIGVYDYNLYTGGGNIAPGVGTGRDR